MGQGTIGIAVAAGDASAALAAIRKAEEMGVRAAWMTSGGAGGDALTVAAAAAAQTDHILLGTSIVQTWSRHPVAAAEQTRVIANLAPGRFRLGVGPGHKRGMETTFGADFRAPLGHLTEYLGVLKGLLQDGAIDFDGRYYRAHSTLPEPLDVPVMASALRERSFEVCGAKSDGAISWVCPHRYLRETALPALKAGAESAGRPAPPLIVHAPICVHEDPAAAREGARQQLGIYPSSLFYSQMFADAGFPGSLETGWTDAMLDAVLFTGDEASVAERCREIFGWGASEILASVVTAGGDRQASADRTMRLLAQISA
jgi:F420-dependent oxidoreductase-like protein